MEIALDIDGKEKVYKQDKTTFKTMQKALAYQKRLNDQMKYFEKLADASIDEDITDETMENPTDDVEMAIDLIVSYFDGQFTYDDFVNAQFESIADIYQMSYGIMYTILGVKGDDEESKKDKSQQSK